MAKRERVVLWAVFVILFIVMVLQAGIYWNTRPRWEIKIPTQWEYRIYTGNNTIEHHPFLYSQKSPVRGREE